MKLKNESLDQFVEELKGEDLYPSHEAFAKATKKLRSDLLTAKTISVEVFGEDVDSETVFSVYDFLAREQFLNTFMMSAMAAHAPQESVQKQVNKLFGGKGFKGVN